VLHYLVRTGCEAVWTADVISVLNTQRRNTSAGNIQHACCPWHAARLQKAPISKPTLSRLCQNTLRFPILLEESHTSPFVLLVRATYKWRCVWSIGGMILTGETKVLNQCPPQISHGLGWDRTCSLRCERPATNRRSYGKAVWDWEIETRGRCSARHYMST